MATNFTVRFVEGRSVLVPVEGSLATVVGVVNVDMVLEVLENVGVEDVETANMAVAVVVRVEAGRITVDIEVGAGIVMVVVEMEMVPEQVSS